MRTVRWLVLAPALFLVACGGSIASVDDGSSSSGGGGGVGGGGGGGGGSGDGITGSYNLAFTSATAAMEPAGPPPPSGTPPSLTVEARLDLRKNADGSVDAVFTSRWGGSSAFTVAIAADALTLSGQGDVTRDFTSGIGGADDAWKTLVLPRDANGTLTGEVRGTGTETVGEGDVVWEGTLTGTGTIVKDATIPEVRTRITSSIGPSNALLPWDPVTVTVAEPVDPQAATSGAIRVDGDHGDTLSLRFDPPTSEASTRWAGQTSFVAYIDDWTRAWSGEPWALHVVGSGIEDRVGLTANTGAGDKLNFLQLGGPTGSVDFDSDVLNAQWWGPNAVYGGGLTGDADPRCESGGCMRLGPVTYDGCGIDRAGFATLLTSTENGHVAARWRLLAQPKYTNQPSSPLYLYGDAITMELAAPATVPVEAVVSSASAEIQPLAAPVDGMSYGTDWKTLDAAAPAGSMVGAAVVVGGRDVIGAGCGGPPPPPIDVEILVDWVTTE